MIVTGRLKQRSYETREGEKRTVVELDVDEVGASLRYATANVTRGNRNDRSTGAGSSGNDVGRSNNGFGISGDDPWGSAPSEEKAFVGAAAAFGGRGGGDQPPF